MAVMTLAVVMLWPWLHYGRGDIRALTSGLRALVTSGPC